jgi:hypothetical protein
LPAYSRLPAALRCCARCSASAARQPPLLFVLYSLCCYAVSTHAPGADGAGQRAAAAVRAKGTNGGTTRNGTSCGDRLGSWLPLISVLTNPTTRRLGLLS